MKKPIKKAQGGIKLKPGQVTAKRAYAIADSLRKESDKPVSGNTKEEFISSMQSKEANRFKSGRIMQRADNAMEAAGGERRYAKDKIMENMMPKKKMGGMLKPVDKAKKPGLAKLPTAVRNKMGFQKNGGKMSKKK